VEHGAAETPAMRGLATYIEQTFSGIEAAFFNEEPKTVSL
jgi:hypothetical protein